MISTWLLWRSAGQMHPALGQMLCQNLPPPAELVTYFCASLCLLQDSDFSQTCELQPPLPVWSPSYQGLCVALCFVMDSNKTIISISPFKCHHFGGVCRHCQLTCFIFPLFPFFHKACMWAVPVSDASLYFQWLMEYKHALSLLHSLPPLINKYYSLYKQDKQRSWLIRI